MYIKKSIKCETDPNIIAFMDLIKSKDSQILEAFKDIYIGKFLFF